MHQNGDHKQKQESYFEKEVFNFAGKVHNINFSFVEVNMMELALHKKRDVMNC